MEAALLQLSTALPRPAGDDVIEVILKLPGESCNLNCSYCYEKRQPTKSDGFIGPELIDRLSQAVGDRPLSIGLHGGEPLLIGRKRMGDLLDHLAGSLRVVDVKLQTNGTLLNREWVALFEASPVPVTIGVSHDGPAELSTYRIDYSGSFSRSSTTEALQCLSTAGLAFGVICVVSSMNVNFPSHLVKFFSEFPGLSTVNFVPCFDYSVKSREVRGQSGKMIRSLNPTNKGLPSWAITPLEFLNFLESVWTAWREHPSFIIEPFVSVIRVLHNRRAESCDFTAEKCGHVFTVYPDGKVTSCDEFESELADINLNVVSNHGRRLSQVNLDKILVSASRHLEKCRDCSHRETCGGGCIATRERYLGSPFYDEYCLYKKGLIDFVRAQL